MQLGGLCFFMLAGFVLTVAIQLLAPPPAAEGPSAVRLNLLWQACTQVCIFLVPSIAFAWLFHGNAARYLCADFHGRKWVLGLIAMVVLLLLTPLNDWLTYWNEQWQMGQWEELLRGQWRKYGELTQKLLSLDSWPDLLLQLLVVALLPAVCEEVFFRGALQQVLQRWLGNKHIAVLVTALLFALAHGDVYGLVPRFGLGVLLGYLFALSGSIVVNVCTHFFNNAMVVILYWLYHQQTIFFDPSEPYLFPWVTTTVCTLAAMMLFLVYFAKFRQKRS